jgi:hypothetical protein
MQALIMRMILCSIGCKGAQPRRETQRQLFPDGLTFFMPYRLQTSCFLAWLTPSRQRTLQWLAMQQSWSRNRQQLEPMQMAMQKA